MKKVISIILLLTLVFCLAACEKNESDPNAGKGDGEQLIIGFNTNNLTNETMTFMVDVFRQYGEEHNIKIITSQCGGNTATLLNNLENFVAGGADGIIFMNYDPEGAGPLVEDLKKKGIAVVSYDEQSDLCDYSFLCSNQDLGYAIGKMAAEWVNENVDGPVEVALMTTDIANFLKERGDGLERGIKENIPNVVVHRENVDPEADQVTIFSNMVSAYPGINILCGLADAAVVQVAEAWYGDLVGAGADLSQYGVFSTDATDIALNLIKKAKTGESIYRGTIDLGLKDEVPLGMIKCCHAVIEGTDPGYPKVNYYNMKFVTEENVDEYAQFLDE